MTTWTKRLRAITSVVGALAALGGWVGEFEGNVPQGYKDLVGVPTACVGHTGEGVQVGRIYGTAQCQAWLKSDVKKSWDAVSRHVLVEISIPEHIAYTDFVFNLGETNFATSSLLRKLNSGNHAGACNGLLEWDKVTIYVDGKPKKVPVTGLSNRRKAEWEVCLPDLE